MPSTILTPITPAARVYGEGISQNGRFLRDLLYQGFNADEEGRIALDGVLAHVAGAGRGSFNYRFAQPSRDAQPTSSVFFPTDIFPFTDQSRERPGHRRRRQVLLDRAVADKVVPKIFFSNTSYEYWGRVAALIHITADGKHDAPISDNVRIYHFTGLQHFSGPFPPEKGKGDLLRPRAAIAASSQIFLARHDRQHGCVGSRQHSSAREQLSEDCGRNAGAFRQYAFPAIPGVNKPHEANEAYRLDFGPNWREGILSVQPPKVEARRFPCLCRRSTPTATNATACACRR